MEKIIENEMEMVLVWEFLTVIAKMIRWSYTGL